MERRQYRNPPIQEAVCELRFAPGTEEDFTFPARLYANVKSSYPGKPRPQHRFAAELRPQPAGSGSQLSMRQEQIKVIFPSTDELRLLGLGKNVLSVHMLCPYPGWEEFRKCIYEALQAYVNAASPAGVTRIGVRYINRIRIPGQVVQLGDYLKVGPSLPGELPLNIVNFSSIVETTYADRPIQMTLTVATPEPSPSEMPSVLLDIDVKQEWQNEPLQLSGATAAVEELRLCERQVFELLITDRTRGLFDA